MPLLMCLAERKKNKDVNDAADIAADFGGCARLSVPLVFGWSS